MRKVKPKRKCCRDSPRCKKCPVVLERLEKAGWARRTAKGNFKLLDVVPKAAVKAARVR